MWGAMEHIMATKPEDIRNDNDKLPRRAPGKGEEGEPERRAPGSPDTPRVIDAPDAEDDAPEGATGVDPEEAHVGATEEQVGDRTGPGAGYDQGRRG